MQVVATLSLKGGVGKTTVALGLAGAALHHGLRALVVDLDPQANATIALDTGPMLLRSGRGEAGGKADAGWYTRCSDAGWSSQVARRAHNPEVAGSNPAPATL